MVVSYNRGPLARPPLGLRCLLCRSWGGVSHAVALEAACGGVEVDGQQQQQRTRNR